MGLRASCFASEPSLLREQGIITQVTAQYECLNRHMTMRETPPSERFFSELQFKIMTCFRILLHFVAPFREHSEKLCFIRAN